jgi:hypothetical protein
MLNGFEYLAAEVDTAQAGVKDASAASTATAEFAGCRVVREPDRDRTDNLFHAIDPKLGFSTTYKTPVAP